jgi:glucokinase
MSVTIAALDVGGTSIKSGVVRFGAGPQGSPLVDLGPALPTLAQSDDAEEIIARLAEMADHALALAPEADGLAIAICGPFDVEHGRSMMRGVHKFEPIHGMDLRAELAERTSIGSRPIRFARDAESAGTGEAAAGAGAGVGRVLTVTLGTGLGTCLTVDARPLEFVGEFGVEHTGMRATPWGRADDALSARGLADRLRVNLADLRSAVEDPANADVVTDHGTRLGDFLRPLVDEYVFDLVVVGGAMSAAFDRFGPAVHAAIGATPVEPAALGPAGPLLGAALLAF